MSDHFYGIKEKEKSFCNISSTIDLLDSIIIYGFYKNASDIHIDPTPNGIVIKFRIDGVLLNIEKLSISLHEELIARIKVIASLRTDIHFIPQDGRFRFLKDIYDCDIRVSIIPTHYGENAVLRLLKNKSEIPLLEDLGFSEHDIKRIFKSLSYHQGMILVTGPTGSGKTSTLYTLISILSKRENSIITLEDPVEYAIPDVRQIPIQTKYGITFANGLRSIVRQDPDIIMVGEIRDTETAQIATNISLTGHLLLSTLHTNSSLGAIPRLIDMQVDPYLVSSTLSLVIAQRLVRRVCVECFGVGRDCTQCGNTGFKGRIVVSETLLIDENLRKFISLRNDFKEISNYAKENGMKTMYEDGMEKVLKGLTTEEEIFRTLHE